MIENQVSTVPVPSVKVELVNTVVKPVASVELGKAVFAVWPILIWRFAMDSALVAVALRLK